MEHSQVARAVAITGSQTALAAKIEAKQQQVWNWLNGGVPTPAWACAAMERATGGKVLAERINPKLRWVRVPDSDWPHPEGRPCIDVVALELIGTEGTPPLPEPAEAKAEV